MSECIFLRLATTVGSKALIPPLAACRLALHFNAEFLLSALTRLCLLIAVIIPHYGSFAKLQLIFPVVTDSLCFLVQLHPVLSSSVTFAHHDTPQLWKKLLIEGCCPHFLLYPPRNLQLLHEGSSFQFPKPCLPFYVFVVSSYALLML